MDAARIGRNDRLFAIKRLDDEARKIEQSSKAEALQGPTFDEHIARAQARSHAYGGKTVFGDAQPAPPPAQPAPPRAARRTWLPCRRIG